MALQGTIDAFPLADVLALLSSSSKTGRLVLEGDRGTATLWIEEGQVVGGSGRQSAGATAASLVFELLRFGEGSFSFDSGSSGSPEVAVAPTPLAEALDAARGLLQEWDAIAAVVPSTRHRIALEPQLSEPSVTIEASRWPLVVAAGRVPAVDEVIEELGLDELAACAEIASLVTAGLLRVEEPRDTASHETGTTLGEGSAPPLLQDEEPPAAFPDHFPIDDLVGTSTNGSEEPWTGTTDGDDWDVVIADTLEGDGAPAFGGDPAPAAPAEPAAAAGAPVDATDEVLRQMSKLSPQAAEAIAAALNPTPTPPAEDEHPDGPSFLGLP
ncbi:MAG TPA: DUF4388 domain-containing protein [Microthrixaceae bacterium]|nr:DUF4388 domain-containing protein [Microthrixaceae bacterium]